MKTENSLEVKSRKIIWRTIQFLLGSFFLLIAILYFISTSKFKNLIPQLIAHYAQESYDVNLSIASYETSRAENFPFLTFKLKELVIEGPDCKKCNDKLLAINSLQFKIQPWDLLQNFINIKDFQVDGVKILLHKENRIRKKIPSPKKSDVEDTHDAHRWQKIRLNNIALKNVFIEYQDDIKEKYLGVNFEKANLSILSETEKINVVVDADCFFNGLSFKQENGAFLNEKNAKLLLNLEIFDDSSIVFENSTLQVDEDVLQLSGNYQFSSTPFLDLHISTPSILLENALSLLDNKLKEQLSAFKIDKPLQAHFHLQGLLKPKHRPKIDLDFQTANADFNLNETQVTNMSVRASYSNHCRTISEEIQRGEDCLSIHSVTGNLFDVHPVNLSGVINDFKKLNLEMAGTVVLDLPSLQPYLTKTPYEIKQGKAELEIDYTGDFGTLLKRKLVQKSGIKVNAKLKNTVLIHNNYLYTNVSGDLVIGARKTRINNLRATRQNTPFSLTGEVDNLLDFTFNERGRLQSDLRLNIAKVDTKNFLPKETIQETEAINPATLFSSTISSITRSLEGKIAVTIGELSHQDILVKNSSFLLFLKDVNGVYNPEKTPDFFQIKNLKSTLADSLKIAADIFIGNIKEPRINVNFLVNSSLSELNTLLKSEKIELNSGQIEIDGKSDFLINDLQNLSLADLKKLDFRGKVNIFNGAFSFKENQQNFTAVHTDLRITPDSLHINNLQAKINDIKVDLVGKISNYTALLTEENKVAKADLKIHVGAIDSRSFSSQSKQETAFAPQTFLQSLKPNFSKINSQIEIKIDALKTTNYSFNDLNLNLTSGKNEQEELFLFVEKIEAKLNGKSPLYADLKITNFDAPRLELEAHSNIQVTELNALIQDDNFQTVEGSAYVEFAYKNSIRDSFTLQDYLLTGKMKARVKFKDAEIFYEPRGLRFANLNGGVSFTEKNLTVDFKQMLFNDNVVDLDGESHDFLPFFFEENKDFTVDLAMNSPLINFHNFDTPKTLKTKTKTVQPDTIKTRKATPIDRLLSEGNLSLRTKIDEVVYDNFRAINIIGRANVNDNEVVLDTFKMRTSDGVFGISSIISDIDKEKINLTADITLEKINASKVLKSFDNFKQVTLTNDNIIGVVNAEINLSTDLNDNYEVFANSMAGDLNLTINKGAFIDFNGLTNLDGFLFKKRRLNAVYFDTLHTKILLVGRDMKFEPTVLNSTAATLTIEGLFTFSEDDKTDMIIEVPLGNIFTRYMERAKIRKNHKKRTGLPIIVEVTEKDKVLDFNIQLRRDDEDK